jgi:small GTP-binding protein
MNPRPAIFLSCDSHEFASFRDALQIELQKKGCFVETQPIFANDYRTVEAMLRQKLSEADAVIHLVGFRYGTEPHGRPADTPRRSYTQMEFDIARELGKPVYAFLSADASVSDQVTAEEESEDAELIALQLAHRESIDSSKFQDKYELCRLAAQIDLVANADFRVDISRIARFAPANLIGRESELALLDDAWLKVRRGESRRLRVITFVARAGQGKTSLVAKWATQLAYQNWPGCDAVFAWSFYVQMPASSDLFLKEAITFFGDDADKEFAASPAAAYVKVQRLIHLIEQRRCLLLLDGLESLQSAPTSPRRGNLNDPAFLTLLTDLAANSQGLCVITTRYSLPYLYSHWQSTVREMPLLRLSRADGVELLRSLGVNGSLNEFEKLVEDVNGHALTLNLIGTFLRDAHGGDIRRRDLYPLEEVLPKEPLQAPTFSYIYEMRMADQKRFGELVLIARTELNLTKSALARRASIAEKTVSRVELGVNTNPTTKAKIISALESLHSEAVTQDSIAESRPLNEAKLILLGNGMVGKTSLVRRLAFKTFEREPKTTTGFSVSQLQLDLDGKSTSLHVWDFGGQEILHATHRFFLSSPAVYLVVLSGRQGTQDRDAEYWLTMVQTHGDSCPTIVALNQFDSFAFEVDRASLREKFPFIRAFIETSAATGKGLDDLWQEISSVMPEVTKTAPVFPEKWFRVRKRLTEVQKNFISWKEYRRICSELGEKDAAAQEALADVLHNLGVVMTFKDQPRTSLMILNPQWVTDAVYQVLNSPQLMSQHGEFTRKDLAHILPKASPQVLPFILGLMEKFELCFPCDGDGAKDRYLVPGLLDIQEPWLKEPFLAEECLSIRYDYRIMPQELLPRFITRTHTMSTPTERWRTGVVLRVADASALVKVRSDDRQVFVHSKGKPNERLQLLTRICKTFDQINADLMQRQVRQYIEVPGHADTWIGRNDLEAYRHVGEEVIKIESEGALLSLNVEDLMSSFGLPDEPLTPPVEPSLVDIKESSNSETADQLEQAARNELQRGSYQSAWRSLENAIQHDSKREVRLRAEFGFLFNALTSEGQLKDDSPNVVSWLNWCCSVWEVLSDRNSFPLTDLQPELSKPTVERVNTSQPEKVGPTIKAQSDNVERKGEVLEEAVARLFRTFFQIGDDRPWKIRKQKRGTQGGYDLSIEWSGEFEVAGNASVRCHIECKNYTDQITLREVGEKLLSEPRLNPVIEHWILISPRSNPSNPLNEFLEKQREEGTFPFEVQVWCPETGVHELFGLEPEVYDQFFDLEGEDHPRLWDDAKRETVRAKWRKKLEPVFRLPQGWSEYLRDPDLLCIHQEKPSEMAATFANHVRMPCRNAAGALLEKPLDEYINDWLATPEQQVLFLLGEFGDGKSFFTYALARQLTANWSPRSGNWMPLRLALRTFPGNARDFLRNRLETFNAAVGGWQNIGNVSGRLVILDGFDEMSVDLDPATITKNIKALLSCLDEFNDCKVLVTSRTHFFHNRKDAQRLLTRTGSAPIYYLAPIGRSQVVGNVTESIVGADRQELLRHLETMNDPIGLASKPLFLEMLKQVLGAKDLLEDLDIVKLYERYIDLSLNRKQELLDDPELSLAPAEILRNLKKLLGRIAIQLQQSDRDYVLLRQLADEFRQPFAQLLWNLSGVDTLSEDARSRVGARSLLGRLLRPDLEEEWPVDFCHRSMREYFVAVQLCEAIENGVETGAQFLQEVSLNHEILEFAAERWRQSSNGAVKENLLEIIQQAVPSSESRRMGGYALTLLYRLEPHLPREFSWEEKVFDGADLENADLSALNFSGSSFRDANLANVNFEQANFEKCDLTNVRIEETTPVLALASEPSREHIVAAYRDGILRQWHLKPGTRTPSKILGKLMLMSGCVVGIHESGQRWLNTDREWTFLTSGNDEMWTYSGHFSIKKEFHAVRFQPPFLVLAESDQKDFKHVISVDLERRTKLRLIQRNASRHFAPLGMQAVVWSDAEVGFRITQVDLADGRTDLVLECEEPTCLDTFRLREDTYLIGGGTGKGVVHGWKVNTQDGVLTSEKILESRVHEGVVTAVAFVDGARLSSGGSDCAIVISRWLQNGDLSGRIERRLQLKMRCRGLRIEGLRGDKEYGLLTRLIQEAESRDGM